MPAAEGRENIQKLAEQPRLGEATSRYVLASRPVHDGLRQILTQIAGVALLVIVPGRVPAMLGGPVDFASRALSPVRDALDALQVPPRAQHHHFHLSAAASALARSLDLLTSCLRPDASDSERDALVRGLRNATDHLRAATRLLPGFEMADLTQACCAVHAGPQQWLCV